MRPAGNGENQQSGRHASSRMLRRSPTLIFIPLDGDTRRGVLQSLKSEMTECSWGGHEGDGGGRANSGRAGRGPRPGSTGDSGRGQKGQQEHLEGHEEDVKEITK